MVTRLSLLLSFLLICCSTPNEVEKGGIYGSLAEAALETLMKFNSSGVKTPHSDFVEIPKEYWTSELINSKPLRVYEHHNNVAIVFSETEDSERGLYFVMAHSSYRPQNYNLITFTVRMNDSLYRFTKKKK